MRRTIDEILTLYELEPSTRRDIYVEGEWDRDFIGWYMERLGQRGRSVYAISNVELPTSVVDGLGLKRGSNRDRVVALALSIWDKVERASCGLMFVVDTDLAFFVPEQIPPEGVLMTDYTSLDVYLLQDEALLRYVTTVCKFRPADIGAFILSIYEALKSIFSLRVALSLENINARIVAADRLIRVIEGRLQIDFNELIRRTLSAANALAEQARVNERVRFVLGKIGEDGRHIRFFVHGHDAMLILGECAYLIAGDSAFRDESRVRRTLMMALQWNELEGESLFLKVA